MWRKNQKHVCKLFLNRSKRTSCAGILIVIRHFSSIIQENVQKQTQLPKSTMINSETPTLIQSETRPSPSSVSNLDQLAYSLGKRISDLLRGVLGRFRR